MIDQQMFTWVVLPIMIFFARILDVSIGTIRFIFIAKGFRLRAALLGFCEVLIWIIAISQIMTNLGHWTAFIAYAAGFATGTYLGMYIEERLSIGKVLVRIITRKNITQLKEQLYALGCKLTISDGESNHGKGKIIFTVIERTKAKQVVQIIKECNPKAFYTIEDVKYASDKETPIHQPKKYGSFWHIIKRK